MIAEPVPVRTLLGARSFDTSLICLRSLFEYSADPVRFIFHDDGTLTDEHREKLSAIAPAAEFVDRKTADETVGGLLAKYPLCLTSRGHGPLFLKLFDIALMNTGTLMYTDSDVLFLRRFSGLFRKQDNYRPIFMSDIAHAYAVRPWRVWPVGSIKLPGLVNTGLIVGWPNGLDLEFLEWLLGRLTQDPAYVRRACWVEQTCWAALAARIGCSLLNPKQVILATNTMSDYHSEVVAIHFVSTCRDKLHEYSAKKAPLSDPVIPLEVRRTRQISAAGMLLSDIRRRIYHL